MWLVVCGQGSEDQPRDQDGCLQEDRVAKLFVAVVESEVWYVITFRKSIEVATLLLILADSDLVCLLHEVEEVPLLPKARATDISSIIVIHLDARASEGRMVQREANQLLGTFHRHGHGAVHRLACTPSLQ